MAFDLVIGTERAQALQNAIQDELIKRGYSPDADPVMAEYITIMLINNKTADQITVELQDLIGVNEYDAAFTEWLFAEASKKSQTESQVEATPGPSNSESVVPRDSSATTGGDSNRRATSGPRSGGTALYQQAVSQAIPSSSHSGSGQKRSASIRSPSPNGQPNKSRRLDLPTGPRAMLRDGSNNGDNGRGGGRSLLDRMGGRARNGRGHGRDEIQARIDAVTNYSPDPMQIAAYNNGMNPMMMGGDMNAMGGIVNQMALQEMMVNQMALMAQMANSMGIINPAAQFPVMDGMNSSEFTNGNQAMFQQQQQQQQLMQGQPGSNRRGGAPGGRGRARGGSAQWVAPHIAEANKEKSAIQEVPQSSTVFTPPIVAPIPQSVNASNAADSTSVLGRAGFIPPERPQSPTLCKFALKCTNPLCRYSHPSPVSTPESGIVLSNDPCEAGKNCKDKDCIKAHVSPAVLNAPPQVQVIPKSEPTPVNKAIPCRYGNACAKIHTGCPYSHPPSAYKSSINSSTTNSHFNQQCRFGTACTRASCPFQHPPGRVLPSTFHRGLSTQTPIVSVPTPETGSIGASNSPHKTVIFNKPAPTNPNGSTPEKENTEANNVISESKTVQATA